MLSTEQELGKHVAKVAIFYFTSGSNFSEAP